MYLHLRAVNAVDYFQRRDKPCPRNLSTAHYGTTYRLAHINRCLDLRSIVRAAGPSPEGATADVIYSFESRSALEEFLDTDPYVIGGVWTSWSVRHLIEWIEPVTQIPVCMDGTRRITLIEEPVKDREAIAAALRRLRDQGSLGLGTISDDGVAVGWMCMPDHEEALNVWKGAGMNVSGKASARSLVWVL
jgi:uncharacterized protein YciI